MANSMMQQSSFQKDYDDEVDVLYLFTRQMPECSETFEERDGLLIDKDPETGETVGVTVLDYEKKFRSLSDLSWVMDMPLPRSIINFLIERSAAE